MRLVALFYTPSPLQVTVTMAGLVTTPVTVDCIKHAAATATGGVTIVYQNGGF